MSEPTVQQLFSNILNTGPDDAISDSLFEYRRQFARKEITENDYRAILNKILKNATNAKSAAEAAAAAEQKKRKNLARIHAEEVAATRERQKAIWAAELEAMRKQKAEEEARRAEENARQMVSLQTTERAKTLGENTNDTSINDKTAEALQIIKTAFNGAKCDSQGFYQHWGECWNDAIQMMFLFSDKLKEVIQQKLAMNTIDLTFIPYPQRITDKFKEIFLKVQGVEPSKDFLLNSAILYFKSVQNRFVRHYITETSGRALTNSNEECPIKKPIEILHVKGRNAIRGATFGRPNHGQYHASNYSKNTAGGSLYNQLYVIELFITTFFTFAENDTIQSSLSYKVLDSASQIKELEVDSIPAILIGTGGHALCFYTCGNQDFFYEDNFGPIKFPWRKMLSDVKYIKFGTLMHNNELISSYHPIIESDDKYYTYYNDKYYEFPKTAFTDPSIYEMMGENKIAYTENKIITRLIPLLIDKNKNTQVVSNTTFVFNRRKRLNSHEYYDEESAKIKAERQADQAKREAEEAKRLADIIRLAKERAVEQQKIAAQKAQKEAENDKKRAAIDSQIQLLQSKSNELDKQYDTLSSQIHETNELFSKANKLNKKEYGKKLNALYDAIHNLREEMQSIIDQIGELQNQRTHVSLTGGYTKKRTYRQKKTKRSTRRHSRRRKNDL